MTRTRDDRASAVAQAAAWVVAPRPSGVAHGLLVAPSARVARAFLVALPRRASGAHWLVALSAGKRLHPPLAGVQVLETDPRRLLSTAAAARQRFDPDGDHPPGTLPGACRPFDIVVVLDVLDAGLDSEAVAWLRLVAAATCGGWVIAARTAEPVSPGSRWFRWLASPPASDGRRTAAQWRTLVRESGVRVARWRESSAGGLLLVGRESPPQKSP